MSVLIATHQGAERIGTCLQSLVDQTLDPALFEVLVVQNGPACATPAVVEEFRRQHPAHTFRLVESSEAGAGRARNLGIDAARGAHLTIVDDDDWVSPAYLETLLAAARPGVLPAALVANLPEGSRPGDPGADFDNYISRALQPHVGRTVRAVEVSPLLASNAAKLIPTALARAVRYDPSLRSGEDVPFWLAAYARAPFQVHVCGDEAVYFRTMRADSVSRRDLDLDFNVLQRLDCIAALHRIESTDPDFDRMRKRSVGGQAARIRDYLTAHPEARGQVAAAAAERGVAHRLPWRQLNKGTARDLAVLFCFTPYLDTSALVAARRIREHGLVTDVVSQDMSAVRLTDKSSSLVAEEFLDEVRILPGKVELKGWREVRRFTEGVLEQVADLESAKGPYRSVYSRAMAVGSHFAAAALKLRRPDLVWRAEFSDPLLLNPAGEERAGDMEEDWLSDEIRKGVASAGFDPAPTDRLFEWAELIAYALADEIVFTNEHQRAFMLDYCRVPAAAERAARIATVSHHPTLPSSFYHLVEEPYALEPGVVHVGYFGVFYQTRGLTEVMDALETLPPRERLGLRLHVFTNKIPRLRHEALARGLADVIVVREFVPFLRYLNLTTRFDALIVNDAATAVHHGVNPYLPSKISDYRGSGSPIWSIVEPGSVLSTLPADYRSDLGDVGGATRALRAILAAGPRQDRPPR